MHFLQIAVRHGFDSHQANPFSFQVERPLAYLKAAHTTGCLELVQSAPPLLPLRHYRVQVWVVKMSELGMADHSRRQCDNLRRAREATADYKSTIV